MPTTSPEDTTRSISRKIVVPDVEKPTFENSTIGEKWTRIECKRGPSPPSPSLLWRWVLCQSGRCQPHSYANQGAGDVPRYRTSAERGAERLRCPPGGCRHSQSKPEHCPATDRSPVQEVGGTKQYRGCIELYGMATDDRARQRDRPWQIRGRPGTRISNDTTEVPPGQANEHRRRRQVRQHASIFANAERPNWRAPPARAAPVATPPRMMSTSPRWVSGFVPPATIDQSRPPRMPAPTATYSDSLTACASAACTLGPEASGRRRNRTVSIIDTQPQ